MNPPYGQRTGLWLKKLADHGNGIALIFARTDVSWFQDQGLNRCDGILFIRGRLVFCRPDGTTSKTNAGAPSCLIAYGSQNLIALTRSGINGVLFEKMGRVLT